MANPTLVRGSTGSAVEDLQTKLNKLGAKPKLKIDGIFGPITEGEVKKFQKRLKPPLKSDGKVGKDTWNAIAFELKGAKKGQLKVPDALGDPATAEKWRKIIARQVAHAGGKIETATPAVNQLKSVCNEGQSVFKDTQKAVDGYWSKIDALSKQVLKLEAEFDAGAFRDPVRSKEIQAEISRLSAQGQQLSRHRNEHQYKLDQAVETLKAAIADLDKVKL